MEQITYNFRMQDLEGIYDKYSRLVLANELYQTINDDIAVTKQFSDKAHCIKVLILGSIIKVTMKVVEERFTILDYKVLKTLVYDDIQDII